MSFHNLRFMRNCTFLQPDSLSELVSELYFLKVDDCRFESLRAVSYMLKAIAQVLILK